MRTCTITLTDPEVDTLDRWRRHMVTCERCVRASGSALGMAGCAHGHYFSTRAAVILSRALPWPAGHPDNPQGWQE